MHDDGAVSMATGVLGQLRESHAVAGLREDVLLGTQNIIQDEASNPSGSMCAENSTANNEHHSSIDHVFHEDEHQLDNANGNHVIQTIQSREDQSINIEIDDPLRDDIDQEHVHGYDDYSRSSCRPSDNNSVQSGSSSVSPSENSVPQEAGTDGQPNEGEDGAVDGDEDRHVINSQEAAEPRRQPDESFYRSTHQNWSGHPREAVRGVELPELLTRRSVSNLLSSGFRESLDQQLTQSYARRQEIIHSYNQIFNNQDNAEHGNNEPNQAGHDAAARPWIVFSGEGYRPRQWYWTRPEFVLDTIQDLELDMGGLYLEMTSMQEMMRGCMQMQIELQRSIKQEVSAALNRPIRVQWRGEGQRDDASQCQMVRKGTCCVCWVNQIDSLLYRCGHMCACSKCATELLNGVGKCPMCCAPIVEVVRAYTA